MLTRMVKNFKKKLKNKFGFSNELIFKLRNKDYFEEIQNLLQFLKYINIPKSRIIKMNKYVEKQKLFSETIMDPASMISRPSIFKRKKSAVNVKPPKKKNIDKEYLKDFNYKTRLSIYINQKAKKTNKKNYRISFVQNYQSKLLVGKVTIFLN